MSWWEFRGFWGILQRSRNVYLLIKKLHLVSWRGCPTFGVQFTWETGFRTTFFIVEKVWDGEAIDSFNAEDFSEQACFVRWSAARRDTSSKV